MALWQIEPVAHADDPRWLTHARFERLVVRADTAAQAREVAAAAKELPDAPRAVGNETPADSAALRDEKLYQVTPLDPDAMSETDADGPDAVLVASR